MASLIKKKFHSSRKKIILCSLTPQQVREYQLKMKNKLKKKRGKKIEKVRKEWELNIQYSSEVDKKEYVKRNCKILKYFSQKGNNSNFCFKKSIKKSHFVLLLHSTKQ